MTDTCYDWGEVVRYDAGETPVVLAYPRLEVFVPRRRTADRTDIGPLARILVRLRGEQGLRQKDVAARSGLDQPYYSSVETGAILRPSDDRLEALDRAFELEPGSLKYWLEHGPPWAMKHLPTPIHDEVEILPIGEDGEIIALFRRVPADRRGQAREIIKRQAVEVLRVLAEDEAKFS